MKYIFLLCLLLIAGTGAYTQTLSLTDSLTGRPIEAAVLMSHQPRAITTTNAHGQADLAAFKGSESIQFQVLGYRTVYVSYTALEKADFQIALQPTVLNMDRVVLSATRWSQNTSNIPSEIAVISPREIALQNPQTAADLLGISGKVFIQKSQQGGGSPMIRGFATNRLVYSVDGVRMNTAIFRGGNIQNVINLDPFVMENTEVLFGPGSVIYGSDAIGGVMSFHTMDAELSLDDDAYVKGKAVARYSSANSEKTGHFDVNVGGKKWALVTSFSNWDYGDLRQGSHGPDDYIKPFYVQRQDSMDVVITQDDPLLQVPSAYSQFNFMQKLRFKPSENWDFNYGFHYSQTSPYGRYDRHNRLRNGLPRYAEWDYGPQKWMMNNLSISHHSDRGLFDQVSLRLAQQSFEESRIDRSLNRDARSTQVEQVEALSANLDFIKETGSKNSLFYGVEFVQNEVTSTGTVTDIATGASETGASRYPQSDWTSLAAYINDEFRMSDQFTMQAGIRYNTYMLNADFSQNLEFFPFPFDEAKLNSGALNGSLGAVFRPTKRWIIKANLGTAFRSPNVDDIGKIFDSEPGSVVIPNPDLKAEYAYNADLSVAKFFGESVKLDFSAYYTLLNNALVRRNFQLGGQDSILYQGELSQVQAIQNAAQARVYGLQAGIEVKLPAGFSFSTNLNFQEGEEELDDGTVSPSRHAAPFFGTSRLNFRAKKMHLQLYAMYQGTRSFEDLPVDEQGKDEIYAKDQNGNNYAPGWYTLNIKAIFPATDQLSISAGVENMTDQRYRPYSSGLSGAGRNFVLSVTARY
ncbi:MAG: TonB-dependent receptor [Bacteroidia bacterium]